MHCSVVTSCGIHVIAFSGSNSPGSAPSFQTLFCQIRVFLFSQVLISSEALHCSICWLHLIALTGDLMSLIHLISFSGSKSLCLAPSLHTLSCQVRVFLFSQALISSDASHCSICWLRECISSLRPSTLCNLSHIMAISGPVSPGIAVKSQFACSTNISFSPRGSALVDSLVSLIFGHLYYRLQIALSCAGGLRPCQV